MELEVQPISLRTVLRSEQPMGHVFAYDASPLEEAARESQTTSHEFLLRLAVKGLWEERPKSTVLAGYLPANDNTPIYRLFLMSARQLAWNVFTKCVHHIPGYIESGQGYITGPQHTLLAWWEYPCTMVALWPSPEVGVELKASENAPDKGDVSHGWFYSDDKCYRVINRYYHMVD